MVETALRTMNEDKPGNSALERLMGVVPQCLRRRLNTPHGYYINHAVVLFRGFAYHGPGGDIPRYVNTARINRRIYVETPIKEGEGNATPRNYGICESVRKLCFSPISVSASAPFAKRIR